MDLLSESGYVLDHGLRFTASILPREVVVQVRLEGTIECSDSVLVEVSKIMDTRYVEGRLEVITMSYRYHAWLRDGREVVRYDCSHEHAHSHHFDRTGTQFHSNLTLDDIPRLDAFVYEAVDTVRSWAEGE